MAQEKHFLRNYIVAPIAVSLITAFILWLVPELRSTLISFLGQLYAWLTSLILIPIWLFILFLGVIFSGGIAIVILIRNRKSTKEAEWLTYLTDKFDGLIWRWRYNNQQIVDIAAFCPHDDTRLVVDDRIVYTHFLCETCEREFELDGDLDRVEGRVERQIERKVRSGTWQKVLPTSK